jgi:hypothetical protein
MSPTDPAKELEMKLQQRIVITALLCAGMATVALSDAQTRRPSGARMTQATSEPSGVHDFDFFVGHWRVHHRRLKGRLSNSREWIEFTGTAVAQALMGGYGNIDDNVLELPGGSYRAVTLRSFDSKSNQWSIWWLDGRSPQGPLDPPVRGGFHEGVGTFYADDVFEGKPVRVRFVWSHITTNACRWEQAFSPDGGQTWEVNWTMEFVRVQ